MQKRLPWLPLLFPDMRESPARQLESPICEDMPQSQKPTLRYKYFLFQTQFQRSLDHRASQTQCYRPSSSSNRSNPLTMVSTASDTGGAEILYVLTDASTAMPPLATVSVVGQYASTPLQ
jgi:hypothetical protein